MTTQTVKIQYLDGIRGLAALNVLLTHLVVGFYPALYNGNAAQVHLAGLDEVAVSKSLWTIFYAGNIAVPMLFILSAYVLSFQFFRYKDPAIATAGAYRRYMRLESPVLASLVISWVILHFGLNYNSQAAVLTHSEWLGSFFQYEPSFWGAMRQGLWECFAPGGNVNYNPVLWTMNFELLGSFSVFGFMALFGRSKRRYVVYAMMGAVFVRSYYFAFVLGLLLSDMQYSAWGRTAREYLIEQPWISWLCIAIGVFIGSYFDDKRNVWCAVMNIQALRDWGIDLYAFYHIIGAAFVFFGCLHNRSVQRMLSSRIFQFCGRISFSLYLIHLLLLCSLGTFVFITLQQMGVAYTSSFAISVAALLPAIVLLSLFLTKFVDEPATIFVRNLQKKYFY